MLLVVGIHFGFTGGGNVGGQIAHQFLAAHFVALLDHRGAGVVAHGGGDLLCRDFHAVTGRIFGEDHLFDILIQHCAGDLRTHLREVGAGVSFQVALEIGEGDHALADAGDHIGRDGGLAVARSGEQADQEQRETAHGSAEV